MPRLNTSTQNKEKRAQGERERIRFNMVGEGKR